MQSTNMTFSEEYKVSIKVLSRDVKRSLNFRTFFNYLYSNLNAGNSIFVCKSAKRVNSRWCIVHHGGRGGGLPAACHLSQWAGGGVGGTAAVIQWWDKHEMATSTRCYKPVHSQVWAKWYQHGERTLESVMCCQEFKIWRPLTHSVVTFPGKIL